MGFLIRCHSKHALAIMSSIYQRASCLHAQVRVVCLPQFPLRVANIYTGMKSPNHERPPVGGSVCPNACFKKIVWSVKHREICLHLMCFFPSKKSLGNPLLYVESDIWLIITISDNITHCLTLKYISSTHGRFHRDWHCEKKLFICEK